MAELRSIEITQRHGSVSETIRVEVSGVDLEDESKGSWFGHWLYHFLIMMGWR